MKKYFSINIKKVTVLTALLSILAGTGAFANPVTIGYGARQDFARQFKEASNVNWKTTGRYNKASFVMNNENTSVFYNSNTDDFVGVSKEALLEDLPQSAINTLLTKYNQYTINSIIKFTDADALTTYFAQLQKDDQTIVVQADAAGRTALYTGIAAL